MQRVLIQSSNLKSVGYDTDKKILEVEFQGGGIYQYDKVSQIVFEEFMTAESKGRYFHANIKNKFAHTRVDKPNSEIINEHL